MNNRIPRSRLLTAPLSMIMMGAQVFLCATSVHAAELIWTGDFETGNFSQYKNHLYGLGSRSKKKIVTSPVRGGKYATELTILDVDSDSGTERAELISQLDKGGKIFFKWDGPEYWIGFSFLFKEKVAISYTFFQIHAPNEPKGNPCDFAGNAFSIWGDGAKSNGGLSKDIVVRVIEKGGVSDGKGAASNNRIVHRYPFPVNEWQDFVVNFKLSTRGDGFYKVWKNGELIYSKFELTNVNYRDSCGNRIPERDRSHSGAYIGIYAPGVKGFRRIYYDEVRVARGSDGYALAAPGRRAAPEPADRPETEPPVAPEESRPKPPVIIDN